MGKQKHMEFWVMTVSSCRDKLHVLHMTWRSFPSGTCLYVWPSTQSIVDFSSCVFYRIIHGVGKPDEVLECIERGVDIFESFFPFQVTERGCALVFSYDCHPDPEATGRLLDGCYSFGILYCGKHNSYLGAICIWGLCSWNKCRLENLGFHYHMLLLKTGCFGVILVE